MKIQLFLLLFFSSFVVVHESTAQTPDTQQGFLGNWGLVMPGGTAGWLTINQVDGEFNGELWTVGMGRNTRDMVLANDTLTFLRRIPVGEPEYDGGPPTGAKIDVKHRATVDGDRITLVMECPLDDGEVEELIFHGKRLSPLPPKPDLDQIKFGDPVELFNGKDLAGWRLTNPKQINGWTAENSELVNTTPKLSFNPFSHYGNLRTDQEFLDFNLRLEFNVPSGGNSGVYLRGRYEAQVVDRDSRMQGIQGVGAIFSRIPPTSKAGKSGGEWQTYDITLVDRHATVILNGTKVIDNEPIIGCTNGALSADDDAPGPIYLQGDHTAVRYRNIVLRPVINDDVKKGQKPANNSKIKKGNKVQLPDGVSIHRDIPYTNSGHERHTLDLYLPAGDENAGSRPLVVWIHGGGWWKGSKDSIVKQSFVLREGFALASINYRLSSDAIFPAQIHDCKAAIRFLRKNAEQYNIDSNRIGVWGSSAGGHLVALLGTSGDVAELEGDLGETGVSSRVQAVCDWFGPTDFLKRNNRSNNPTLKNRDISKHPLPMLLGGLIQDRQDEARAASPVSYISADDPPFLIMHGDSDLLVKLEQSTRFHHRLRDTGIPSTLIIYPGHGHSFFKEPEQHQQVIDFFSKHLLGEKDSLLDQ
ncbi:Carboxylesterase NlhH [Planctomycetes bacterium CA13]|uniref:Carboxylesterase NlhH n=1 Tax=Novipirellula herctigrandis TaxID=2527986 RepID=A0A5C5Z056_9BACT|nr:Carboxylesterase NlhH [Planctomycetes bacterium CA13]